MKCKNCGQQMPADCLFCTACGAKLTQGDINSADDNADVKNTSADISEKEAVVFSSDDVKDNAEKTLVPEKTPVADTAKETSVFSSDEVKDNAEKTPVPEKTPAADIAKETTVFSSDEADKLTDAPAAPEIPEAHIEKTNAASVANAPKKLTAGRAVGASVISIFTIVFLIVFNLIFCGRIGLSGDIVGNTAKSLSTETLLDAKYDGDESVLDYIYGCLDSDFIKESGAEKKDIRSILIKIDFSDFAADKLGDYAAALINGKHEGDPSLEADEIKSYLEEHGSVFNEELDYRMTEKDYESVSRSFEDAGLISDLSINEWNDYLGFSLWNLRFLFSFITIGIFFALVLVLCIWTVIVLDKNGRHVMGFFGTVSLIAGLVTFIPSAVFLIGSAHAALITGTLAAYAGSVLLMPFAVIAACTGLFEIIVGAIFRKIKKHLKKRQLRMNGGK